MKKNMLSIIILFLLIINISLTAIMMFSLVVTNRRAINLMSDVAAVLRLELPAASSAGGDFVAPDVAIADVVTYDVAGGEAMTIPLKMGPDDSTTNYILVRVSLAMDSSNRGYKRGANGGDLSAVDVMIQDIVIGAFGKYTADELKQTDSSAFDQIRMDILVGLHTMYQSDFIFNVSFRDIRYS